MKFGITLPDHGALAGIENVLAAGREAESLGYDSVWVGDFSHTHTRENHLYNTACGSSEDIEPDSDPDFIEPFTTMAALAAVTRSITIGSCAIQLPIYNPITFAKQAAALDLLSHGRMMLGIGIGSAIGFFRKGYDRINFPFRKRGYIFNEYIRAIEQLWWSSTPSSFQGKYLQFSGLELYPKPKSLKILIGSGVAPKGLERVIKFSNGVILSFRKPSETKVNVETIREEAKKHNRDPDGFEIAQTIFACIGKTNEGARKVLTPTIAAHAQGFGSRAMSTDEQAHRKKRNVSVDDLLQMSFVGTADDIIKQIEIYKDAGLKHAIMFLTFRGKDISALQVTSLLPCLDER